VAREVVDADSRSHIARRLGFPSFERRAGGIGDAIDGVEETRHRGGIDQCGRTQGPEQRSARLVQGAIVTAKRCLSKCHERLTMNNAAVSGAGHDNRKVKARAGMLGARTEQLNMTGGSIGTLVERRHPSRDELNLGMSDGAILVAEIAHGRTGKILMRDKVKEAPRLVGDQS
jgi:hypothetical protein